MRFQRFNEFAKTAGDYCSAPVLAFRFYFYFFTYRKFEIRNTNVLINSEKIQATIVPPLFSHPPLLFCFSPRRNLKFKIPTFQWIRWNCGWLLFRPCSYNSFRFAFTRRKFEIWNTNVLMNSVNCTYLSWHHFLFVFVFSCTGNFV